MKRIISKKVEFDSIERMHGVPFVIWCFWYKGDMNDNRIRSLNYMKKHIGVPLCLITKDNLPEFILEGSPLHPAFEYLSDVHKSDYLRIYLLHHYGGGWHDIKPIQTSYHSAWSGFANPECYLVGKPEIKGGAAKVYDSAGRWMPSMWRDLVVTNRWVGRANTPFSQDMFRAINQLLDKNLEKLKKNPARHPYDKKRCLWKRLLRFELNDYPLAWTVVGNIFHPLNYKYLSHISPTLPADEVENLGLSYR